MNIWRFFSGFHQYRDQIWMDRCWIFWVSLQKWQWHVMMLGIVGAYFVLFLCATDISLTRENLKATPNKETRNKSRPLIQSHNIIQRYHQGTLVLQVILLTFASIYLKRRCQSTWTHLKVFEAHYMWIGTKYCTTTWSRVANVNVSRSSTGVLHFSTQHAFWWWNMFNFCPLLESSCIWESCKR